MLKKRWAEKADELNGMKPRGAMCLWVDLTTPLDAIEDGSCNPFFLANPTYQPDNDNFIFMVSARSWGEALRRMAGLPYDMKPLREYQTQTLFPVAGQGYVESDDYMLIRFLEDRNIFVVQGRREKLTLTPDRFESLLNAVVEQCLFDPQERGIMADELIVQQVPLGGIIC